MEDLSIKKTIYFTFLFLIVLLSSSPAFAVYNLPNTLLVKSSTLLHAVVGVVFILGGFGLIGLAVGAIFGNIRWRWFASLAFGLFIVAMALSIVAYINEDQDTDQLAASFDYNWSPIAEVYVTN